MFKFKGNYDPITSGMYETERKMSESRRYAYVYCSFILLICNMGGTASFVKSQETMCGDMWGVASLSVATSHKQWRKQSINRNHLVGNIDTTNIHDVRRCNHSHCRFYFFFSNCNQEQIYTFNYRTG